MRVGTAGLILRGQCWDLGHGRWIFILVAMATVSARAGEERDATSATVKSTTPTPAASSDGLSKSGIARIGCRRR